MLDRQDNTPLHRLMHAYDKNEPQAERIFNMLAGTGAFLNRLNFSSQTPLHVAVLLKHHKCVAKCLEYNLNCDPRKESFNLNALVGKGKEPIVFDALRCGSVEIFFLIATHSKTNILEFYEEIREIAFGQFYSFYIQIKLLELVRRKRYRRNLMFKTQQTMDTINQDPRNEEDYPPLIINFPNTMMIKSNLFPHYHEIDHHLLQRKQKEFAFKDFESLSVVSSYIDSKRELFLPLTKSRIPSISGISNCIPLTAAKYSINIPRISVHTCSMKINKNLNIKNTPTHRIVSSYPVQPKSDQEEEQDLQNMNESNSISKIGLVLRGIKPQTMTMRTSLESKEDSGREGKPIRIPVMGKKNTMMNINRKNFENKFTNISFGQKMVSAKQPPFDQNELDKLYSIYKKVLIEREDIDDFYSKRFDVYKQLAQNDTEFPIQALVSTIEKKCGEILKLDLGGQNWGSSYLGTLMQIHTYNNMIISNLNKILHQFIDIEEFKIVAKAMVRNPYHFISIRKNNNVKLMSFDLDTYNRTHLLMIELLKHLYENINLIIGQPGRQYSLMILVF